MCSQTSHQTYRVLVCGGRDYQDRRRVFAVLNEISTDRPITCVIHGTARGADRFGELWANKNHIAVACYQPDWRRHGRAAGFIRNQQMLDQGKPDLVVAFPGGRGTADMVHRANVAKVHVIEITELSSDAPTPPTSSQ